MSRIAGFVALGADRSGFVQKMLDQMQPVLKLDWDCFSYTNHGVTTGWTGQSDRHCYESDQVTVVMDGYIYNYKDLSRRVNFAEVFAELYLKGDFKKALQQCNGDFVIALTDKRTNELWLARDRFGVKPLYYTAIPNGFAFASRLKSLLCLEEVDGEVNKSFVGRFAGTHYRYFDNDPTLSPYQKILQLPAAHCLNFKDGRVTTSIYWELKDLPDWQESEDQLAERYRELLMDASNIRFEVSQKAGFTLSGGMDSSSVLASVRAKTGRKQHAFSTVYVDKTYDETSEIATMLGQNVEQWHKLEIGNPDVFSIVSRMIDIHDEPVATATWLSHYLLCEETVKEGFESLFGGLGGDELNAGEYEYFFYNFADLVKAGKQADFEYEVKKWVEYHNHPIFKKNLEVAEQGLKTMLDLNQSGLCLPEKNRLLRYADALNQDFYDLYNFKPTMVHPFKSYMKNRTYQDMFYETAPCCLRAEDRQTMAFGIENFVPFFDHRLVEFMFRVPGELKIKNGITKVLARKAMKGILPDETRNRIVKTGWNAPAHQWFSGKGLEQLRDLVHSSQFRDRGIYNLEVLDRLIKEHERIVLGEQAKDNHMMFFWQLVNLELWLAK